MGVCSDPPPDHVQHLLPMRDRQQYLVVNLTTEKANGKEKFYCNDKKFAIFKFGCNFFMQICKTDSNL